MVCDESCGLTRVSVNPRDGYRGHCYENFALFGLLPQCSYSSADEPVMTSLIWQPV